MTDSYIEYVKLHILSLEQDLEEHEAVNTLLVEHIEGALETARHLLTVYGDLLYNGNLRKEYNG